MDPVILSCIALVLLLAAIVLIRAGEAQARRQAEQRDEAERLRDLAAVTTRLADGQQAMAARLDGLAAQAARDREEVTRTLQERLDGVSRRLGDSLQRSSDKTSRSLSDLQTRLALIDQAQKNITELSSQVVGLQDILDNKQARGAFGEVQLHDLVSAILPPSAYRFQVTLSNKRRVDCLIDLPAPPGPICIDAKFPLEGWHALRRAENEAERRRAAAEFRQAIRKHVNDIAERYLLPGETADSALMFVPAEAVYAELHAGFPEIVQASYRAKVWIVSPTTLMATLNTVRAVLKDARMREQADVIQREMAHLIDDVGRLDKRVENLKRHFLQAEQDIKEIDISTGKIVRTADRIEQVQFADEGEAVAELDRARLDAAS